MSVRPAKTQISLGIRPVWSEPNEDSDQPGQSLISLRCAFSRQLRAARANSEQLRLWSDWADAQADLILRWAHSHFVGFVMSRLSCWQCLFCLTGMLITNSMIRANTQAGMSSIFIHFVPSFVFDNAIVADYFCNRDPASGEYMP